MENFKVLGAPIVDPDSSCYKGIYRREPFPLSAESSFFSLWKKESAYVESLVHMGITTELTLDELFRYAALASQETGNHFEVVCFGEEPGCPYHSVFYGIDVIEKGGYSMLGDGLFNESGGHSLFKAVNQHIKSKLNCYGLFSTVQDAEEYREIMAEVENAFPGTTEAQPLHTVFVYKVLPAVAAQNKT